MNKTIPAVDGYLRKNKQWLEPLQSLREIVLGSPLTEEVKWRVPCYTLDGANVLFLGALKESCTISFVKGALLKDPKKILIQQTENSQSVRVIRFKDVGEVLDLKPVLKAYVDEAVEIERAGLKVPLKTIAEHAVPEELQAKMDATPALAKAFKALTPGRQRAYFLYVAGAKQSTTRAARVERCVPRILEGKGLDD